MAAYFALVYGWLAFWIPIDPQPLWLLLAGILVPVFALTGAFVYLCWKKGAPLARR